MSPSDWPTLRPPKLASVHEWLKFAATAVGIVVAVVAYVNRFATDDELAQHVASHNTDAASHEALRKRLDHLEAEVAALQSHVGTEDDSTTAMWRYLVGLAAADRESHAALRAAAAGYYRGVYDELVRKGTAPDIAFSEALRQPWYTRPRQ